MALLLAVLPAAAQLPAPDAAARKPRGPAFASGELLLQFKPRTTANQRAAARGLLNAQLAESIHTSPMKASGQGILERITLPPGLPVDAALRALAGHPNLQFAEVNWTYQTSVTSDDPYYTSGQLWGMYGDDSVNPAGPAGTSNPYGIHAEQAWNAGIVGSQDVIVAIIDEGIQVTHPDLAQNIWVNPFETPGDGIDNDGNGYIDDVYGWDFFYNTNAVYKAGEDSHGTHVAGTIGGRGGNGTGVAGVNWQIRMISLKFLGPNGGSTANAIKAVDYLVDIKQRHNLRIIACNNSWGGGGYSEALHSSIIRAAKAGILFVAAAGNVSANNDTGAYYPCNYNTTVGTSTESAAAYDAVISVASITSSGALSSFSSYGSATVDLGAPGSGIYSSMPTDTYGSLSGTSMATPHVTGAIALYASQNPTASAEFLKTVILNSTTPTPSLAGITVSGGRLNVFSALQTGAYLSLNRSVYRLPDSILAILGYPDGNADPNAVETITIEVASSTETAPETVVLTETGPNSGRFQGTIDVLAGPASAADGQLQAAHADQIIARQPALNLTATATVDAVPPVLSAISASPTAVAARILWTTDEASSSVVAYGLAAGTLTSSKSLSTPVISHVLTLSGLAPATTYYYQVASSDAAGNASVGPVNSFTTPSPAPILFVDDDLGALYDRFFKAALDANALSYDVWDIASAGTAPTTADLLLYPLVIWNTGYEYAGTGAGLTATEQSAVAGYLNAGGRLFLSGQDILWSGVSTSFRTNYLRLAGYTDDITSSSLSITGVTGSVLSDGQVLSLTKPSDYPSLYVDGLTPGFLGEGLYTHGVGTSTNRHTAVGYRGDYANGGFGIVFFAFPFESISTTAADPNNQNTVLRRVLDYLQATPVPPGVTVSSPSPSATISESGSSASFTLKLNSRPAANVTFNLSSSDPAQASVSPASITFTPSNYGTPQTVTVTGVEDAIDDGDVTVTVAISPAVSSDPAYQGLDPADLTFTVTDNDTAGFIITALSATGTTEAGGTVTFSVRLATQPLATVTLPITSSDLTEGIVLPGTLTFTPENWNIPQTVTVSGVDDPEDDGNVPYTLVIGASSSSDPLYEALNPPDASLINTNDDSAGVVVSGLSGSTTSETGSTVTFTVRLNSRPLSDVSLAMSSSDLTEGAVAPGLVTFTPMDWNQLQTVTVTGLNDWIVDGNQTFNVIVGAASSADLKYNGINPSDMPLSNVDDDVAQTSLHYAGSGAFTGSYSTAPTTAGTLTDIRAAGGAAQTFTEGRIIVSSGKQTRYTSGLEYRWTFPAVDGANRFTLVASRSQSSEVDDFQFQYSADNGASWVNLALVNSATLTTYTVNGLALSGNILIRAYDINRAIASSPINDTLTVDQMVLAKVITDFRPTVSITATDADAGEPANPGQFTLTRSSTSGALTVPLTLGGTAVAGTDYQALPASVTFPNGVASVTVDLLPIDDLIINPSRTVVVAIPSSLDYNFQPGNPASAAISLIDNDVPPRVYPASESTTSGTITAGSFASLQALDGNSETIAEFITGGKTTSRKSYLDHRWTFQVGSVPVTGFQLNAYRIATGDNENFRFEYSTNGGTSWVTLVNGIGTSLTSYSGTVPSLTGTILIRVVDTDQSAGKYLQDSITVDQLYLSR